MIKTIDWRKMPPGIDMDWLIAQRLGWTLQKATDGYTYLVRPDGGMSGNYVDAFVARQNVWQYSRKDNIPLPLPLGLFFIIMANDKGATCGIGRRLGDALIEVQHGVNIAEARARAWLCFTE